MTSRPTTFKRYVPNGSKAPYRRIMNSEAVQALVLAKARQVAEAARQQGVECACDVRPGRMRAHARATAAHERVTDFRTRGHNQRVDRVLQAALQQIRGGAR